MPCKNHRCVLRWRLASRYKAGLNNPIVQCNSTFTVVIIGNQITKNSSLVYLQSQERSVFVPTTLPSKSTTVCQQGIEHWGFPKIWKTARITAMFHRNSQATHQHHNDSLSEPRNLLCSKRWILQLPKTSRRNLGMFDQEHHPKISVTRHHHAPTSIRERRQLGSRCYTKPCAWFHHHCGWKKSD